MQLFPMCHCILEVYNLIFDFCKGSQLRVAFELHVRLWTRALGNDGNIKTLEIVGDGLNASFIMRWSWASRCY
jgi:hypothetical protein